ncbi:MAG: dihydropteroate synthase [Amaricoccus sp.]|uniref:dihydropteroate synthase n=1 Tax=Amaricoccus sp. TaxID=1872485 RepID=UPI0039E382CF
MTPRWRPLPRSGGPRPPGALALAGGPLWFADVALHRPGRAPELRSVSELPEAERALLTAPRAAVAGLSLDRPRIMGILNVTPDSFSDGGAHVTLDAAVARARAMLAEGADILDIGGESTRPGAEPVPPEAEADRVVPVIAALRAAGIAAPISIDTRNPAVAVAAFAAGADLWNDVAALGHAPEGLAVAAASGRPVCLMHAKGDPRTMQEAPVYGDVLLEVAGFLAARVAAAEGAGISRSAILVDPGIGFGKTVAHNLTLIRGLSMLHGLGCGILFGASRKRFIGTIADVPVAAERVAGSVAVALEALRQGAQVLRVHDVKETRQAVALWSALNGIQE